MLTFPRTVAFVIKFIAKCLHIIYTNLNCGYEKFGRFETEDSHRHHHVRDFQHKNIVSCKICPYVRDLSPKKLHLFTYSTVSSLTFHTY
jgi:hypothetical protein